MERIIAYCGLLCNECPAYQATQAKDEAWLERVAANWRVEYSNPTFTKDNVACNGCHGADGKICTHCYEFSTRTCGLSKGVANCGECREYATCDNIQSFFKYVPSAKVVLDEVHARMSFA